MMRISIENNLTFDELKEHISDGAKFIAYQYIISVPLFLPTKRLSKLFLIERNEKPSKHCLKYNILNCLVGLMGMPFGPPIMVKTIISNIKGGIDFTEDVMVNLTEESFNNKEVKLIAPSRYFLEPSKSNKKELNKIFKKLLSNGTIEGKVIIGYFICTEKDEKPYHVVGISSSLDSARLSLINEEIYKRFYKHVKFEIVSLTDNNYEHIERLKTEGYIIE